MNLRGLLSRHGRTLLGGVSVASVLALVATIGLLGRGFDHLKPLLDDGSAWVANSSQGMLGHANTELLRLDSAATGITGDLDVLQNETTLGIHNRSKNTLDVLDAAAATITESVPLPAGSPEVTLTATHYIIWQRESGDVWTIPVADIRDFSALSAPTLNLGTHITLAADDAGNFAGFSSTSGDLVVGSLRDDAKPLTTRVPVAAEDGEVQLSLLGGTPVLYQAENADLLIGDRHLDLGPHLERPESARLLRPSASGGAVLIAHSAGALSIAPGSSTITTLAAPEGSGGAASAPVRVGSCEYLAWSAGLAQRRCTDRDTRELTLASPDDSRTAEFAVRGATVVLSAPGSGRSWAVQRGGELIDNWADFIPDDTPTETVENDRDEPPELTAQQLPPVAVDDAFGARPGRGNVLPVLLNDSDPNGDALIVSAVTEMAPETGTLSIIADGQKIQFLPGAAPPPELTFGYTIDDGYGNTDSATVTVTMRSPEENSAPVQARPTRTSVELGATVRTDTLEDWVDPDSDPIFLAGASVAAPDTVTYAAAGTLGFTEAGGTGELRIISTEVSDGLLGGAGSVTVTTGAPGTIPLVAESFTRVGFARQEILIEPLTVVRGGSGAATLTGVTAPGREAEVRLTPDYGAGTFTATASSPGSYLLEYAVADGSLTATGIVRLEVAAAPEGPSIPVTAPVTAFLYLQNTAVVDVLASAYDPGGGVLSIAGVNQPAPESGVLVETVDLRILRVTLRNSLHGTPITVGFTVSNGVSTAPGTLTILEIPEPVRLQPPVAVADSAEVRVGSVVDIPVLKNDSQPDGKPLSLEPELGAPLGEGEGTLFISGEKLRYLAPATPGTYVARYRVSSTDGQWAEAPVTLTVREVDAANNRPPVPRTLTARVLAGKTVQIPVPLTGIDPDGDTVTLVGAPNQPRLGSMGSGGRDYLEYTASPYSSGTDEVEYSVVDALGARGTGLVRIGVIPAAETVAPPVAVDDLVSVRPGVTLDIPVTDNDSDPENAALAVISVEASAGGLRESFTPDSVKVTAPATAGSYGLLYTIRSSRGATSSAWLYLRVSADAPLARPEAADIILGSRDIAHRDSVTVDPLGSARFSEGGRAALDLRLVPGYPGATREADGRVSVSVDAHSHIVPFEVFRRDAPTVSSTALIWVPGTSDSRPELKPGAPALSIAAGESLRIALRDYVLSPTGGPLRLVEGAPVSASHAGGDPLTAGDDTLLYRSLPEYWGAAAITFTVTDSEGDQGGTSTLTLPITVTPSDRQPPILTGANISLEPGAERVVELRQLTDFLYPERADALRYEASTDNPSVASAVISGQRLTLRAVDGAHSGASAAVLVSVFDGSTAGKSAVVRVQIVNSTRPLVSPIPDTVTLQRGTSASVTVLENDEATNPFPGKPLRVGSVGAGSSLPAGVAVDTSADRSTVRVSISKAAATGTITIPYTVLDLTESPERMATGYISVQIQDVPEPPGAPRIVSTDLEKASVTLAIPHAFENFSPITGYTVSSGGTGPGASCENPDLCVVSGLEYGTSYQFRAAATNALGSGEAGVLGAPILIDGTPVAPTGVTLAPANRAGQPALVATWAAGSGSAPGSALIGYDVSVSGPGVSLGTSTAAGVGTLEITAGVVAAQKYTLSVVARNKTHAGPAAAAGAVAVGPPTIGSVGLRPSYGIGSRGADVYWTDVNLQGATAAKIRVDKAADHPACSVTLESNVRGDSFHIDRVDSQASYVVSVSNGLFCTQKTSNSMPEPPQMGANTVALTQTGADGDQRYAIRGQSADRGDIFQIAIGAPGSAAPGVGSAAWVTYAGPVPARADQFGVAQQIFVRACETPQGSSCSVPVTAGAPVTAFRTRAQVLGCPAPGGALSLRGPANNGVEARIEAMYYQKRGTISTPITGVWVAATEPVPAFPAGAEKMQVRLRTVLGGQTYEAPETLNTDCAGTPPAP